MSTKKKIQPRLRFNDDNGNDFPEWEARLLGECIISHKGGAPLKPSDFVKVSAYEVIPKKGITEGGHLILNKEEPTFCTEAFFKKFKSSIVDNSYLITTLRDLVPSGPNIGYIVKFENEKTYVLAQGVYGLKVNDSIINRDFLIQYSNTKAYRTLMQTIMVGSTQVHIRNSDFFGIKISLPTIEEQRKIANFLSSLDDKIRLLEKELEELKDYKKGVMQAIFDFDTDADKDQRSKIKDQVSAASYKSSKHRILNNYEFIRFKDENGNDYPDWVERLLGELMTFKNGLNAEKHQYGKGVKYISVLDIMNNNFITYDRIIGSVEVSEKEIEVNEVNYGDVLFQRSSETREEVGQSTVYLDHKRATFGGFVIRGKAIADYNPVFMNYLLKTDKARKEITDKSGGSTRYNIGQESLREVKVYLPCAEEQQKIADFLMVVDEKIDCSTNQIKNTRQYKQALLQQLFN